MSPHAVRGTGTRHTIKTVERGRERGGRRTAWAMSYHTMERKRTPPVRTPRYARLRSTSTWNSDTCAYVSTPLTFRGTQALFVANSVKCIHLTVLTSLLTIFFLIIVLKTTLKQHSWRTTNTVIEITGLKPRCNYRLGF